MRNNSILVFIEWRLELNFFSRFVKGLRELNYDLVFLTNSLSIYFIARSKGLKIFLCKKSNNAVKDKSYLNSIEVLGRFLNEEQAELLYYSVVAACENLVNTNIVKYFFVGNGSSTAQIAMKQIASKYHIPTLFFENANIAGKTFVDPKGVNAASSLYEDISILNEYSFDEKEYQKIIQDYLNQPGNVVKKKNFLSIENPYLVFDYVGYSFFNLPTNQNYSLTSRIFRKLKYDSLNIIFDNVSLSIPYIFYPLQVSFDSQILLNSEVSAADALEFAYEEAKRRGLQLIVKPHPKEKDTEVIKKIVEKKNSLRFSLTDLPASKLVKNSGVIVTINSTVGLEGLMLRKEVIFLGKTFYKNLTPELLPKYICGYLADFPYNSSEDISADKIKEILKRTGKYSR